MYFRVDNARNYENNFMKKFNILSKNNIKN